MQLSDVYMLFVILPFTLYILMDGYDLGIGMLTLFDRDTTRRREMYELVAWMWDGNGSWLVLFVVVLWCGFPLVIGVALPALYVVLIPMLWAIIARGVATELIDQHDGWHRIWGPLFSLGSLLAAFCQGAAFGGVVAGLGVRGSTFAGGPFTFLHHGYAVLTGFTAVALYLLAGCAWVYLKSDGELQRRVARVGRVAIVALAAGTAASWALLTDAGTTTLHPGATARLPIWIVGAVLLGAGLVAGYASFRRAPADGADGAPALATATAYAGGLLVFGGLLYPHLVPPHITVHSAASPHATLLFIVIALAVIMPIILMYQTLGYRVFRGKVSIKHGEAVA